MRNATRLFVSACVVAAGGLSAAAADEKLTDQQFVIKAGTGGMHEVAMGKLAQERGMSADVKKFGERLVKDHTKANEELKAAAQAAGVGVPTMMLPEQQKELEKFKAMSGAEFDKAFAHHMVKDHEKDIALFEKASKECENPKLKEFASKTLPTLKEHLSMAKKLPGNANAGAGGAAAANPARP